MDHQVQNAGDVDIAAGEGPAPHGFEAQRPLRNGEQAHGAEHGAFLVAAGQDGARPARGLDQGVAVLGAVGQGLFDIDVQAPGKSRLGDLEMAGGGRGDGHQVDGIQEAVQAVEHLGAQRARQSLGALLVGVEHGGELHAAQAGVLAGVVPAEDARAGDSGPQDPLHAQQLTQSFRTCEDVGWG